MGIFSFLRNLRHGPLKFLGPIWLVFGKFFRYFIRNSGLTVSQKINCYGPFLMDANFAFSNFENWGYNHNNGFVSCIEACRDKNCILDIGAHIGLVSLPISTVIANEGKVYAFEPAEANRKYLLRHIKLNNFENKVFVEPYLVGAFESDCVEFYEANDSTGMNTVVSGAMEKNYSPKVRSQIELDTFCKKRDLKPEVIKIDVEGAEIDVLLGALEIIQKQKPVIFLSVHPRQLKLFGQSCDSLLNLIKKMDYRITNIDGSVVKKLDLQEYKLTPKEK